MIRRYCDLCKREINQREQPSYVVRIEVCASFDPTDEVDCDDCADRNHLEEIQEMLDAIDEEDLAEASQDVYHRMRFDLCSECRRRFLRNPLGRDLLDRSRFSEN